jgi:hypothetical protein
LTWEAQILEEGIEATAAVPYLNASFPDRLPMNLSGVGESCLKQPYLVVVAAGWNV